MERVGEHPVPAGPLAVRWLALRAARRSAPGRARTRACGSGTPARRRGAPAARAASSSPTTGSTTAATRSSGTGRGRALPHRSCPGEEVEVDGSRCGRRSRPAATGSPSTSSRSSASGSRRSARRRSSSTSTSRRGSTSAGSRVVVHGGDDDGDGGRARRAGGAARGRRTRSRRRTSSRARCPRRTGRGASSTRTRRASRRSAGSIEGGDAVARGRGRRAAAAIPRSQHPLAAPVAARRPRARRARGPAGLRPGRRSRGSSTAGSDFDCDAVVDAREHERAERERDDRRDREIDRVAGRRRASPKKSGSRTASTAGVSGVAPVDHVDEARMVLDAGDVLERVEHRREEEPRQQQRRDEVLDVAVERVQRRDGEREAGDEADGERRRAGCASQTVSRASGM